MSAPAVVEVADLRAAGLYVPAGSGPEPVAGDFWEISLRTDGLVSLVVGDVSGHGRAAVERMVALRAAARAVIAVDGAPASVLGRLDVIMQALGPEDLATMWCGLYDPATGALRYSSAGHPPPAVRSTDGRTRSLALSDAPPLGTGFVHLVREHRLTLEPGAVMVAYSDGLIERPGANFDDQLCLLTSTVDAAFAPVVGGAPEDVACHVLEALVPDPASAQDDVCVLVVSRAAYSAAPAGHQEQP